MTRKPDPRRRKTGASNAERSSRAFQQRRQRVERWIDLWQKNIERETSFRNLFDEFYPVLSSFFIRRNCGSETIEDLIQETFLRVYRGLPAFQGTAPFEHWLFEISANVLRQHLRRKGTSKRSGEEISVDGRQQDGGAGWDRFFAEENSGESTLRAMLGRERLHRVQQEMLKLPPKMRRCAVLRWEQEYSIRDIAALLQVSPQTVKVQLFKARQRLNASLEARSPRDVSKPEREEDRP